MKKPGRFDENRLELIGLLVVPLAFLWLLLVFTRAGDLNFGERMGVGIFCTLVYGPLMYLRIRN